LFLAKIIRRFLRLSSFPIRANTDCGDKELY
jgi:hypothetical protein